MNKDWIRACANEIVCIWLKGMPGHRETVAACIERHLPVFEHGVAYMSVPRCDQCKHWLRGEIPIIKRPSHGGYCLNESIRVCTGSLETAEDFGCVQWEARWGEDSKKEIDK